MRVLFVDDEVERFKEYSWNNPHHETDYAKNPYHAQRLLMSFPYDVIMLDHDLGTEMDGTGLAQWMIGNPDVAKFGVSVICHSINEDGRKRMVEVLKQRYHFVYDLPFAWKETIYAASNR